MSELTYNISMEEDSAKSRNLTQLILLLLAFIAGVFAARLWYDTRPVPTPLERLEEAEISTQVQESSEVPPNLPNEPSL